MRGLHHPSAAAAHLTVDSPKPRVLVADRRRAFAEALADLLDSSGFEASSAPYDKADQSCRSVRPSRVLLDGDPPLDQAIVIADAARAACHDVRVLLLVGSAGRGWTRALNDVGADTVLSRQSGLDEVLSAIRGEPSRSHSVRPGTASRTGSDANPLDRLTPRERQILQVLMSGEQSAAIADALGISPHTVRTHVQNTFAKLAVSTRLEAASIAREAGLRPLALDDAAAGGAR